MKIFPLAIQIDRHQRESLAYVVMEFPGNPGALLFLRFNQSAA